MRYVDLHCDTLTVAYDRRAGIEESFLQAGLNKLNKSGCAAQCFAIFTQGACAAPAFERYLEFYSLCVKEGKISPVLCAKDLRARIDGGGTGGILTVENLGFATDVAMLERLRSAGVRMVSLVWNFENDFAYPNLIFQDGVPLFARRVSRGLKPLGRQAVKALDELKIIVDISHLSDGGADEILKERKIPVVASHSNAAAKRGVSRNLTDEQIKKIAACGGVVGVNFCKDFLGEGDTFACVLKHIKHIVNVGGEDCVAFGSDFDGIPPAPGLEDCERMPQLLDYLNSGGLPARVLDKLCFQNFLRVFKDVCG